MRTILIVDDDPVSLSLLSKLVEKLNYGVLFAQNGVQALEALKAHPVDLVIADYDMPEMDGLTLLKNLKSEYPRLPFILVTAYSNLGVIREAWEFGAFDFFQKPVFVDRLHQTIRLAMEYGHLTARTRKFPTLEDLSPDPDLLNVTVVRDLAHALEKNDLLHIVEEYETHARIELEQMLRFSLAKNHAQVRAIAHRLSGTSINLGLVRISAEMKSVEDKPDAPLRNAGDLEDLLERSIFWLKHYLKDIYPEAVA